MLYTSDPGRLVAHKTVRYGMVWYDVNHISISDFNWSQSSSGKQTTDKIVCKHFNLQQNKVISQRL